MKNTPAIPQPNAVLRVTHPTAATQFHFGNQRLFACVNGLGELTQLNLAEGIRVLNHMHLNLTVNGHPAPWQQAEAFARSFTLSSEPDNLNIRQTTTCDEQHAVIFQKWDFQNNSESPAEIMLEFHLALDLHEPHYKPFSLTTFTHQLLTGKLAQLVLGPRRWKLENQLGEKIKTQPVFEDTALQATVLGFTAGEGHRCCTISCDPQPELIDPQNGLLRQKISLAPHQHHSLLLWFDLGESISDPYAIYQQALAESQHLRDHLYGESPLQRSLYAASQITAESMFKRLPSGFSGLWAGPGYAYPPRIYFRDSYWTAQPLLDSHPDWVREHILSLALGIHRDGTCPSGVIDPAVFGKTLETFNDGDLDWMPEHFDSPAFFVLLVNDYLQTSGDITLLKEQVHGRSILDHMQACGDYFVRRIDPQTNLPHKGQNPNDWADNVIRSPWVTYDLGLIYGAWNSLATILKQTAQDEKAQIWQNHADTLRKHIQERLWCSQSGWFANYAAPGKTKENQFCEDHLSLDTLTTIRFGLADTDQSQQILQNMINLLFSKNNQKQPYQDFGVLCCFPPYQQNKDLFGKSAHPYRYHNGAEWPYLSVLLAWELKKHGFPKADWLYALTRWWEYSLEQGWLTPVEFHSPGFPPGAFLQGWSGMGARVLREMD